MKLICISSGSSGNSYLLTNSDETLIIEMGMPFKEVKKALDWNITSIVGAIASHEHGDHFHYHKEYEQAGIPIYAPFYTEVERLTLVEYGGFTIQGFPLVHSVPTYGFYITHEEIGKLLFITDTEYVPQNFLKLGINHILVEANYDKALVDEYVENRNHVFTGHMEIGTALDFIKANMTYSLKTVLLCHLSSRNSDGEYFIERLNKIVPTGVRTAIAEKGVEIEL